MSSRGNKKRRQQRRQSRRAERRQEEKDREEAHKSWVTRQTKREAKLRVCDALIDEILKLDPSREPLIEAIVLDYKNTIDLNTYHARLVQARQSIADQGNNNLIDRS